LMFMLFLMFEKYDNKRPDHICDQMTLDEFRLKMVSYWHSVDDEAKSL